jgi:hypothetical protein
VKRRIWSPLCAVWSSVPRGVRTHYTGLKSEPELFIPYDEAPFASKAGSLQENPVLFI